MLKTWRLFEVLNIFMCFLLELISPKTKIDSEKEIGWGMKEDPTLTIKPVPFFSYIWSFACLPRAPLQSPVSLSSLPRFEFRWQASKPHSALRINSLHIILKFALLAVEWSPRREPSSDLGGAGADEQCAVGAGSSTRAAGGPGRAGPPRFSGGSCMVRRPRRYGGEWPCCWFRSFTWPWCWCSSGGGTLRPCRPGSVLPSPRRRRHPGRCTEARRYSGSYGLSCSRTSTTPMR